MILNTKVSDKLRKLIGKAQQLLQDRGEYFTDGAKLALEDMLGQAELALEGRNEPPFNRSREFLLPREEEAIQFATSRYTMVPPFEEEEHVYTYYGLEPALKWFVKQDMLYEGTEALPSKAAHILNQAQGFLDQAKVGEGIGEHSAKAAEQLIQSMDELLKETEIFTPLEGGEELARSIVTVYNRLGIFRHSRRLRTDVEPGSSLYLDAKGMEELRSSVLSKSLISEQYKRIEKYSDLYDLCDLERAVSGIMKGASDYAELNRQFYLWSFTDKIVNFKVPSGAVKAELSFTLPSEENEQDGLGHVWIDDVEVFTASGTSLNIRNGGFEEGDQKPLFWRAKSVKGEPILQWESKYPYCGGGEKTKKEAGLLSKVSGNKQVDSKRSLYISNPTSNDEGCWTYDRTFEVESGMGCTLTFAAKLDGKLKKGLQVKISYLDEQEAPAGEFIYFFQRKSSLPGGRFQLPMQCDAIRYAMTGDIVYAQKTKLAMLYILHDFCQGAEHWLVTNLRPEGSDCYGAVQGGRLLSVIATSYSLIRSAGVFKSEERTQFYALLEYMLRYMLDLRDRTEWTPYEAQCGCSNWQTDMCAGTGLLMMVLTDFPNRLTWLNNANAIMKAQLELNVNPDGSWPESIRYHHAALERFAGYALALKNVTGEDWFCTTPLLRMFNYGVHMQTPGYTYFDGRIGTPPFGDHALGGGEEFGYYAPFLHVIAPLDPSLADQMFHTWMNAGQPFKKLWGESVVFENMLSHVHCYTPRKQLDLASSSEFPDAGIHIFRKHFGTAKQSYFAIMSSPKPVAHGHLDQGSFILYKNSVPLVMDSGIEGYFDSSTNWYLSSYSHACLQFATQTEGVHHVDNSTINLSAGTYSVERGWADVPKCSRVLDIQLDREVESITLEIANPEGEGRHIRHVSYVREPDLYIIHDEVFDYKGKVLFNLPVAATHSRTNGSRVYSKGAYDVDLETVFLSRVESVTLDQGRSTRFYDRRDGNNACLMDYVRAVADAREGFLTVLYPKERGKSQLCVTSQADGSINLMTDDYQIRLDVTPRKEEDDGKILGYSRLQIELK